MARLRAQHTPLSGRIVTGLAVLAVSCGSLLIGAGSANAHQNKEDSRHSGMPVAAKPSAARSGAGYLARQITANGGYLAPFGTPDIPNTAYSVVALTAAGVGGDASRSAVAYLKTQVATGLTEGGVDSAGTLADVILAAVAAGENPRRFGGTKPVNDLVARLLHTRHTNGTDRGLFGASDPTYDGAFRQGLALAALDGAGVASKAVASSVGWLERQQCANGLWTAYRSDTTVPCVPADPATFTGPDTNSTALAVEGLAAYGRTPNRSATIQALGAVQSADAGFPFLALPGQPSDPNSTAVVIQALRATKAGPASSLWVKAGANPFQALAAYQLGCSDPAADRGAYFIQGNRSPDAIASVQAVPAQAGAALPVLPRRTSPGAPTVPC